MSIFSSPHKVKRLVLAGAVTATTIAGTLYGAGIKTEREVAQVRTGYGSMYPILWSIWTRLTACTQHVQKAREITLDERIESLRNTRQNLVGKKELVEKQMRDLDAKVEERKQKGVDHKRG